MRRKAARAILRETSSTFAVEPRLVTFGTNRSESDLCTLHDIPARFELCLDCEYRRGTRGLGILCGHRFGIDPTMVDGKLTQIQDDSIQPI